MENWEEVWSRTRARARELDLREPEHVLLVRLGERKMAHLAHRAGDWRLAATMLCTGSPRPPSNQEGSLATPLGLHAVDEKFGHGVPAGTVFVGRVNTGKTYAERADAGPDQKALVTTRILWLAGLEPGFNAGGAVDTKARYIYIHGTNHPDKFPEPHSSGCLNLRDDDLIRLYAEVPVGTWVWIEA